MSRARILVDAAVYAPQSFAACGPGEPSEAVVEARRSAELLRGDLTGVCALVTRTVTRVGPELLARAPDLRFVGSASAGFDHVDRDALHEAGVAFAHAPGCNADAVAQWVLAAMLHAGALRIEGEPKALVSEGPVGIVGVGATGGALARLLKAGGVPTMLCDPLRAQRDASFEHRPLDELLAHCQSLSLHVPLTREGPFATERMLSATSVREALQRGRTLVNACRGDVIALPALDELGGLPGALVLDVWPGEPQLDWDLLAAAPSCVRVTTPHIAGYSARGKARATDMVRAAMARHFGRELPPAQAREQLEAHPAPSLRAALISNAQLERDDRAMRALCARPASERPAGWRELRANYPLRAENSEFGAPSHWDSPGEITLATALGFCPPQ